jgi:hypothetical protein
MTEQQGRELKWDVAAILAFIVTILVALATLTPYVWIIPEKNMNLVTQAQTTLWNGWFVILAFYFKQKGSNPVDAETISTQANVIKKAQDALAPVPTAENTVKLEPGDKVEVKGVEPTKDNT